MTKERLRYIQVVMEALIPVLGYFLWDWTLYFILLFYLLDVFSDLIFNNVKCYRIIKENSESSAFWFNRSVFATLLLGVSIVLLHFALFHMDPARKFTQELMAFWTYEDMGIQQGYFLIPLVFFASFQQYKLEFLMPARYKSLQVMHVWQPVFRAYLFILVGTLLVLLSTFFIVLDELVYIALIVLLTTAYKLYFRP